MTRIGRSFFLAICFFLIFNFSVLADELPACTIIYSASLTPTASGWIVPGGQTISTTTYPDLFSCLGYAYGGSGNNFVLPNLNGKFILGKNVTYPVGVTGGEISHTLATTEIPAHNHDLDYKEVQAPVGVVKLAYPHGYGVEWGAGVGTSATGGGLSHNNMPPYIALVPLIKTTNDTLTNTSTIMLPINYTITAIISNTNLFTMTTITSTSRYTSTGIISFNPFTPFEPIRTLTAFMILLFIGVGLQKPTSFIIAWIGLALFGIFSYNIPIYWYWTCLMLSTAFIMYRFFNSMKKT